MLSKNRFNFTMISWFRYFKLTFDLCGAFEKEVILNIKIFDPVNINRPS